MFFPFRIAAFGLSRGAIIHFSTKVQVDGKSETFSCQETFCNSLTFGLISVICGVARERHSGDWRSRARHLQLAPGVISFFRPFRGLLSQRLPRMT